MTNGAISKAASDWDTVYMQEFGIDAAESPLAFEEFFDIGIPTSYGLYLPANVQRRVQRDLAICESIGALGDDCDARLQEIDAMDEVAASEVISSLYRDLNVVANMYPNIEANVDVLTRHTFEMLGFGHIQRLTNILSNQALRLTVAKEQKKVYPDLTIEVKTPRGERTILLVQEDKSATTGAKMHSALPQLVAEALAAYRENKAYKPMSEQVMYGITVMGTLPTFYKIPVNDRLLKIVEAGTTTDRITTSIQWCSPVIGNKLPSFVHATQVVRDTNSFLMYLRSYEAMRRLLSRELDPSLPLST